MRFRDKYWFLSNMYPCPVTYKGVTYKCAESAYQAQKCANETDKQRFANIDGFKAKKRSHTMACIPMEEWFTKSLQVMAEIEQAKYQQNPELLTRLHRIKGEIAEDNSWGDTFWGRCDGKGENHLGRILMQIRDQA